MNLLGKVLRDENDLMFEGYRKVVLEYYEDDGVNDVDKFDNIPGFRRDTDILDYLEGKSASELMEMLKDTDMYDAVSDIVRDKIDMGDNSMGEPDASNAGEASPSDASSVGDDEDWEGVV